MATSSFLGGTEIAEPVAGKDTDALGPSDNSDSGSDAQGAYGDDELSSDSDAAGTGERASIDSDDYPGSDILPDHIEREPGSAEDSDDLDVDGAMVSERTRVDNLAADEDEGEDGEDGDDVDEGDAGDSGDRQELDFDGDGDKQDAG